MEEPVVQSSELKRACKNCGAELTYEPGTTNITCDYCGHKEVIKTDPKGFVELELYPYLQKMGAQSHSQEITMLDCKNCGAHQHVEENYKSLHCVYCGAPLVIEDTYKEEWIVPGAVLPFQINQKRAHQIFQKWVKKLWFAPNKLKKAALDPQYTKGLYLPYWTFDAQLAARYKGERGDYYYETERYRDSDGKMRSRQVRKTRWSRASGQVSGFVDDTLVNATENNKRRVPQQIARWNLEKLKPFDSSFLAGFVTEKYTVPLETGHTEAQRIAQGIARSWCRRDIGGDEQRVHHMDVDLSEETFKHVLLPIFISSYRFKGKEFQFFVNGENGSIKGKRPYSPWKIFFTVLAVLMVILLIILLSSSGS